MGELNINVTEIGRSEDAEKDNTLNNSGSDPCGSNNDPDSEAPRSG